MNGDAVPAQGRAATGARPRLDRVVDDLGAAVLRVVAGSADRPVQGVTLADPVQAHEGASGAIVLAVGVVDADAAVALLTDLAPTGAAALLLKAPVAADPSVVAAAASCGVTVVEVGRGVAWEQLFLLLRRLLEASDARPGDDGPADLFQLANEIGALVDAPITIEDPAFRVLAFSGGQEDTDEGRVRTVLGRQVPESYRERLARDGVFRELATSSEPVYVPEILPGHRPRAAIAVRAGSTVLGSVWAVVSGPLTGQRLRALRAAAEIVALHLLRERAAATAGDRLRAEQLVALLTGDGDPAESARRLGVSELPVCVLAVESGAGEPTVGESGAGEPGAVTSDAGRAAELRRVSDALGLHLRLVHRATAVATLGDTVYGLVPVADDAAALRVIEEFVGRAGSRTPLRAGAGRVAHDAAGVAPSRDDADDVLRVLRLGDRATASARSVRTDLMVLRLGDGAGGRELPADAPVAVLLRHDAEHRTDLTGTLAAYLDAFGDVGRAAASMHVHPNTFRYRLGRLAGIAGVDLWDPDVRLAAMLDLRLHRLRAATR